MRTWIMTTAAAFALLGALVGTPVQAAEIVVYLNQATESGVRELATAFEKATGHKVNVSFQAGPNLNRVINEGTTGDLTSLNMEAFDAFTKSGKVVEGSVVEYARIGNGIAVKTGAAKPDISTPEAFKQAMLNAKSIGHTNAGTGPYNTRLFQKLGIYDQIKSKITIVEGRLVAAAVAAGDIEIGIQQTNVIQPHPGSEYLGPLPADLMEYGRFGIGILSASKQRDVATAFAKFMAEPGNVPLLRKAAMEAPVK